MDYRLNPPLSLGFPRQECWSGLPFPPSRLNPCLLHWQVNSLLLCHQGSPYRSLLVYFIQTYDYILYESESHSVMSDSLWPHGLYSLCNSPGQIIGVGSFSLLQGIFPTQGLNPSLSHCRWILYHLSHKGSWRILECVAYSISSKSSWPRSQTRISCIAGRVFTNWAI